VRDDPAALRRQSDYLDALSSHSPLVRIVDGRFQEKERKCRTCGDRWTVFEEKETDVNIAISLLEDAVTDRHDTAILLSGDSDLIPAIRATKRLAPQKRVVVAFPPNRHSAEMKRVADGFLHVGIDKVRNAQLPEQVVIGTGVTLSRPKYWI
jgi:NYN domain